MKIARGGCFNETDGISNKIFRILRIRAAVHCARRIVINELNSITLNPQQSLAASLASNDN